MSPADWATHSQLNLHDARRLLTTHDKVTTVQNNGPPRLLTSFLITAIAAISNILHHERSEQTLTIHNGQSRSPTTDLFNNCTTLTYGFTVIMF